MPLARNAAALVPLLMRTLTSQPDLRPTVASLLTILMCQAGRAWRVHDRVVSAALAGGATAAEGSGGGGGGGRWSGGHARWLGGGGGGDGGGGQLGAALVRGPAATPAQQAATAECTRQYERLRPAAAAGRHADLLSYLHAEAARHARPPPAPRTTHQKLPVRQEVLRGLWESRQLAHATAEDWAQWISTLSVELLRESPSPALRACAPVAQMHSPLTRRLFQVNHPREASP